MQQHRSGQASSIFTLSERAGGSGGETLYQYTIRSENEARTLLMRAKDALPHPFDWIVFDGEIRAEAIASAAGSLISQFERLLAGKLSISARDQASGFGLRAAYDDNTWSLDVGFGSSRVLLSSGAGPRWKLHTSGLSNLRDLAHCFKSSASTMSRNVGSFECASGTLFRAGFGGEWADGVLRALEALNDEGARNLALVLAHASNMNATEVVACTACGSDFPRSVEERWKKTCRSCFLAERGLSSTPKEIKSHPTDSQPIHSEPSGLDERELIARIDAHLGAQGLVLRRGKIVPFVITHAENGSIVRPKIMDLEALAREFGLVSA